MSDSNSILTSVKQKLGIVEAYDHFDSEIIDDINATFQILYQIGVGSGGFTINDASSVWRDYISSDEILLSMVKTYIPMRVRMMFNTPSGAVKDVMSENIKEFEWRIREHLEIFK